MASASIGKQSNSNNGLVKAVASLGGGFVLYKLWNSLYKKSLQPENLDIRISQLLIHPIKGCQAVAVSSITIHPRGIENDREYAIAQYNAKTNSCKVMTQNNHPKICLIKCTIPNEKHGITLVAPSMPSITVPLLNNEDNMIDVSWNVDSLDQTFDCWDQGNDISNWLTQYLNKNVKNNSNKIYKLVKIIQNSNKKRIINPNYIANSYRNNTNEKKDCFIQIQNTHPLLIASEESVNELEKRLKQKYTKEDFDKNNLSNLGLNRFRPNIVLKCENNMGFAHFEDNINSFKIENKKSKFEFALMCARCPIPQIDQTNAIRGHEPKSTLMAYRKGDYLTKTKSNDFAVKSYWHDRVFFGSLFMIDQTETINIGEKLVSLTVR